MDRNPRVDGGPYIDGAYDKVLWKLHDPEFPLRLLPPYILREEHVDVLREALATL